MIDLHGIPQLYSAAFWLCNLRCDHSLAEAYGMHRTLRNYAGARIIQSGNWNRNH